MASFPPFKKSLFRIITVITIICLLVISCTIPASAFSDDEFPNKNDFPSVNVPISRPQLDGNTVYAELLTKVGSDYRLLLVIFEFEPLISNDIRCVPVIVDDWHIEFRFKCYNSDFAPNVYDTGVRYSCYYYDNTSGLLKFKDYGAVYSDDYYSVTMTLNGGIYGAHYYNCIVDSTSVPSYQCEFVVNYASEGLILNYLKSLNTNLTNFYNYTMSWFSAINSNIVNIFRCFETSLVHLTRLSENFEGFMADFYIFFETLLDQNNALLEGPYISEGDSSLPPSQVAPPRDDSTIDDIKEAENDAVGGKTDEEIQQDVEDALDQDKQKEQVNGEDIPTSDIEISHNVFNVVFDFMGPSWNSYFILVLTVAFAAFLIGRRY